MIESSRFSFGLFLGYRSWGSLARLATHTSAVCCDLSDTFRVYPGGTVALALALQHRSESGKTTELALPTNSDVLNYLERIDFFRTVEPFVQFDRDPSSLRSNRRNPHNTLTEILDFRSEGFDKIHSVARTFFDRHAPSLAPVVLQSVTEALLNILHHSAPNASPAPSLVQIQVLPDGFEMAFGDLGLGFLTTLRTSPRHRGLSDELVALRGVLHDRLTRFPEREHRGGGLATAGDILHDLGGEIRVVSRDGVAARRRRPDYTFSRLSASFPGSLIWFTVPAQTS